VKDDHGCCSRDKGEPEGDQGEDGSSTGANESVMLGW